MYDNFYNNDSYQASGDYYNQYVNEQLGSAKKTISRIAIGLVAYILASNAAALIGQLILMILFGQEGAAKIFEENIYVTYILNFASQYLVAFPVLFFIIKGLKPMRVEKEKLGIKDFFVAFLISQAFMHVGSLIGEIFNMAIGSFLGGEITNDVSDMILETPIWLVILAVIIIGPIFEELIFRKLVFDRLSVFGTKTAIIVTAIAFGLFHGNLYQLFYATALGFVLGFIYAKTRNVWYPIILHMLINCFGTLPALLLNDTLESVSEFLEKLASGEPFDIAVYYGDILIYGAYSFIYNALIVAGVVLFIMYAKKRKLSIHDKCTFKIPKGYATSVTLSNVGAILFLVVTGINILLNLVPVY